MNSTKNTAAPDLSKGGTLKLVWGVVLTVEKVKKYERNKKITAASDRD